MGNEHSKDSDLVIITGMSGAGKTVAVQSFEDLGYFCVDNLPPTLLAKFLELMTDSGSKMSKVALVMDLRGREFFDHLFKALDDLTDFSGITPQPSPLIQWIICKIMVFEPDYLKPIV